MRRKSKGGNSQTSAAKKIVRVLSIIWIIFIAILITIGIFVYAEKGFTGFEIAVIAVFLLVLIPGIIMYKKSRGAFTKKEKSIPVSRGKPAERLQEIQKPKISEITFKVAGTSYRQDTLREIADKNYIYDYNKTELIDDGYENERVYEFEHRTENVVLEEEPNNEHDKNAVKVLIEGEHVGYIKKGSCTRVKNLIKNNSIVSITAEIKGGRYKVLSSYYDDDKEKDVYTVTRDKVPVWAKLYIKIVCDNIEIGN